MKQRLALAVAVGLLAAAAPALPARADVIRDDEWHLRYLNVTEANQKTRGEGVTVAIVDRGVDRNHDDLTGAVLDPVQVAGGEGKPATTEPADGSDPDGHGTALAGTIAAHGHGVDNGAGVVGVAPGAKVMPIVLATPADRQPTADEIAAGIETAIEQRTAVILVGYSVSGSDRLLRAVRAAEAADAIVVAADGDQPSRDFAPYPAAYDGVLAAVPLTRGGDVRVESTSGRKLGLGVPGFQIMTTNSGNRYRVDDGSASPGLLAGAVALLRSAYPDAKRAEIVRRLSLTAVDIGPKGQDPLSGLGRLDLVQALTRRLPGPSPSPSASASRASINAAPPGPTVQAAPFVPRSRGPYGWLLALPLAAVIAGLAWYAGINERRLRATARHEGQRPLGKTGGDEVDSVGVQS